MNAVPDIPPEKRTIGPIVWLSLVVPMAFILFLIVYEIISPVYVEIRNGSDQPLTGVTVEVQTHRLTLPDVPPARKVRQWFRNTGETSPYTLRATWGDAGQIEKTDGEIRSGMRSLFYGPATFTIGKEGEISFTEYP